MQVRKGVSEPPVGIEPTTFSLRVKLPGSTRLHSSPLTCGNALNERPYDGPRVVSTATELHHPCQQGSAAHSGHPHVLAVTGHLARTGLQITAATGVPSPRWGSLTNMEPIRIGLVADPAAPTEVAHELTDLGPREGSDAWDITVVSKPFTIGSEDIDVAMNRLRGQAQEHRGTSSLD
jgi:hypothetical protein